MEELEIPTIEEGAGQKSIGLPNMTITVVNTTPNTSVVTNVNTTTVPNVVSASKRIAEVGGVGLKARINERKVMFFY